MDESFIRMARAATKGSSIVQAGSTRSATRRSSGRVRDTLDSPAVRMQLTEDDGILQWEETTGAVPNLGQFRSHGRSSSKSDGGMEIEFDRLEPSKITEFLEDRDRSLTPNRGLRKLDPKSGRFESATMPTNGRALVFVHGTFSNGDNMISGLREEQAGKELLEEAVKKYRGNVFVFDHATLSVGPILNAFDFQRQIEESRAKVDIVAHSRGGLVTRWWCETFDSEASRCDKAILVGSPLAGTGLAAPPNIRDTIHMLSQVSMALQTAAGLASIAAPVFSIVEVLLRVISSVTSFAARTPIADAAMAMVPGLFAMSRVGNNPELTRLLESQEVISERYFAVKSNFEPTDPAWKFWRLFRRDRILDKASDILFDGDNDLVVDTPSMSRLAAATTIPKKQTLDFGRSETVHHMNYFSQDQTIQFLSNVLL